MRTSICQCCLLVLAPIDAVPLYSRGQPAVFSPAPLDEVGDAIRRVSGTGGRRRLVALRLLNLVSVFIASRRDGFREVVES